jgi:hypothetical protein
MTNLFLRSSTLGKLDLAASALGKNKDALLLTVDDRAIDVADGKAAHLKSITRFDEF